MAGILKEFAHDGMGDGAFMFGTNDQNLSNEIAILAATAVEIPAGTVMGRVTGSGQYKPLDPAANDGSQNFAGILYRRAPVSAAVQKNVIVARRQGVNGNALTYLATISAPQKAVVEAAMSAAGVIVRY